jgi:hypothetical protein
MNQGLVYYNVGKSVLVRLAVSLYSCRLIYKGPITILSDLEGFGECLKIAEYFKTDCKLINLKDAPKRQCLLNKCVLHETSPYDITVFLDADTIVLKDFTLLFELAEKHEFVTTKFCNWETHYRRIKQRIDQWGQFYPDLIQPAMDYKYAINTGVFAFRKDSLLMKDWFDYAIKGYRMFIPDETCCQLIIPKYPHILMESDYNESCKYGKITDKTIIIHFHGKKHARIDNEKFIYNSDIWYSYFDKVKDLPFIKDNIQFDRILRRYNSQRKCL